VSVYLYVWTPADDGQIDGENDDKDEYAGKEEEPVLPPELHACKSIIHLIDFTAANQSFT
jgi:hypothetical protein